jgi:uncharacterized protein
MKDTSMIKDLNLKVDGLKIRGQLYLPDHGKAPYPAVILCHGVPSGIVDPADGGYPLLARTISAEGFAVYTFRFRGTGESEGNFEVTGWTRDLTAAIKELSDQPEIDRSKIILTGFSAGAVVSLFVTARDKSIAGVAACASPADFSAISESDNPSAVLEYFRKIGIIRDPSFPPSMDKWLNGFRSVNALKVVGSISPRPVLLIHAAEDPVVPLNNSEKLYESAREPRKIIIIEGSEHRLRRNITAVDALIQWLKANFN